MLLNEISSRKIEASRLVPVICGDSLDGNPIRLNCGLCGSSLGKGDIAHVESVGSSRSQLIQSSKLKGVVVESEQMISVSGSAFMIAPCCSFNGVRGERGDFR